LNEAETRAELINPALKAAGWGVVEGSRIRREVIAPGRLEGAGRRAAPQIADYVLIYRNTKLAVIEAKKRASPDTEGVGQAKLYAGKLQPRLAYSTNGAGVYQIDMKTGAEGCVSVYPGPGYLWVLTFAEENLWRDIVLMRPIHSIIEFKQIIGRGTRLYEGKDYFTIFDFVRAYDHFNNPEWDGEPLEPEPPRARARTGFEEDAALYEGDSAEEGRRGKVVIKLADGKARAIQHMMATSFWGPDGRPLSATQFVERLFGELPQFFKDEDELRRLWSLPDTRKALLSGLSEKSYGATQLAEISVMINAEKSDLFDVLAYIAFALVPITRAERADARKTRIFTHYDAKLQAFLDFVLSQYVSQGVGELDQEKLGALIGLKYGSTTDAAAMLGGATVIRDAFVGFQRHLFEA
jgi:hypothetical protein